MAQSEDRLAAVAEKASDLLQKLDQNGVLQREECKQMICTLEDLKQEKKSGSQMEVIHTELDRLVDDFNGHADQCKLLLQAVLNLISEGRVPGGDQVVELDTVIGTLREKYAAICQFAEMNALPEELPIQNSPVSEYLCAVQNSEYIRYLERLKKCQELLGRFTMVQSTSESYALALRPFQEKVDEVLNGLSDGAKIENEQLEQVSKGPRLFFDAMNYEDMGSDEASSLLDRAEEYYSSKVCRGLAAKSYFLE